MAAHELLTCAEMAAADAFAVARGVPAERLMENAGLAVARLVTQRYPEGLVVVLCGPGNNGGDGFVVARLLREAGREVRVAFLGDRAKLSPEARANHDRWGGPIQALTPAVLDGAGIIVDGLFGAGLARPLEGVARTVIEMINEYPRRYVESPVQCIAIDVPSGIAGDSGAELGVAVQASVTVTFFRKKPGHVLLPGRVRCGEVVVADIGIPDQALPDSVQCWENSPASWRTDFPTPRLSDHKYDRGHVLVWGGSVSTGAARLGARAALRVGAGLVTIACDPAVRAIYAGDLAALMVREAPKVADFAALIEDTRKNVVLIGPGAGVGTDTAARVLAALNAGRICVLDADALTSFKDDPKRLFAAIKSPVVLTPHDGEYAALFAHQGDRLARARAAARESGAVVVLKGADTVIADPHGGALVNCNAPPELATAGSGDVLAGLIAGLIAQEATSYLDPPEAAAAAVWMHGDAAARFGPGLVADDLPTQIPAVLKALNGGD